MDLVKTRILMGGAHSKDDNTHHYELLCAAVASVRVAHARPQEIVTQPVQRTYKW